MKATISWGPLFQVSGPKGWVEHELWWRLVFGKMALVSSSFPLRVEIGLFLFMCPMRVPFVVSEFCEQRVTMRGQPFGGVPELIWTHGHSSCSKPCCCWFLLMQPTEYLLSGMNIQVCSCYVPLFGLELVRFVCVCPGAFLNEPHRACVEPLACMFRGSIKRGMPKSMSRGHPHNPGASAGVASMWRTRRNNGSKSQAMFVFMGKPPVVAKGERVDMSFLWVSLS